MSADDPGARRRDLTAPPLAARLDHVVVEAADEQALFDLFTRTLGLPVAWPVADWGFVEGGVVAGTANIGCNRRLDPATEPEPTIRAVALEPAAPLEEVAAALAAAGVAPTPLLEGPADLADRGLDQPWACGWTNVLVAGGPPMPVAFYCDYHHDTAARVAAERATAEGGLGPLGVTGLAAVVVRAEDPRGLARAWGLTTGWPVEGLTVVPPAGAEIRIEEGEPGAALVLRVASLETAGERGATVGLRLEEGPSGPRIHPGAVLGLDLRLEA